MKKKLYLTLFIIPFLLVAHSVFAQTASVDTIGDKGDKKSGLKIGLNYLSNAVLLGRADTVRTSLIEPELKYTFAPGIYVTGNLEYVPNRKKHQVDGGSLGLGYDFDIGDNLSGGVSYTKLFYSSSSTQIGSSINHSFNANLDYNIGDIITPSISVDYNIIKQGFGNDILLNAGINHDFTLEDVFGDGNELTFTPTATVNAGTQNFYDAYFSVKKYKVTQKGQAKEAKAKALLAANAAKLSQFTLLDYELSIPIEYKTGIFIFSVTPTYAIARNKLPAQITSTMVNSNNGIFYLQVGVVVKI